MQGTVGYKIPLGIKSLAKMMALTESEVRFFPKLNEMREIIKNYNYNVLSKEELINKLESMKSDCETDALAVYVEGLKELSQVIQYKY